MTARQVWEGMLTELSKANAPSLLLHEFNYYFNKAINQYINKRYNIYDVNQQTTDDLRVLKATAILKPQPAENIYTNTTSSFRTANAKLFGGTYEVNLPDDYLHMLNCVCIYEMKKTHKCYDQGNYVQFAAKRLTADSWSKIINDYYNRPTPERPYYYIHNVNKQSELPTNAPDTDMYEKYHVEPGGSDVLSGGVIGKNGATNFTRTINLTNGTTERQVSTVEKETALRYSNPSKVRCEIRYGRDNSVYELTNVFIDYIKSPQYIRLTQDLVDLTEDTSLIMEFPDYVCQEIINELTSLIMARDGDPRLQTLVQLSQSIANPSQAQLAPQQQG